MYGSEEIRSVVVSEISFDKTEADDGLNKMLNYTAELENGALLIVTISFVPPKKTKKQKKVREWRGEGKSSLI